MSSNRRPGTTRKRKIILILKETLKKTPVKRFIHHQGKVGSIEEGEASGGGDSPLCEKGLDRASTGGSYESEGSYVMRKRSASSQGKRLTVLYQKLLNSEAAGEKGGKIVASGKTVVRVTRENRSAGEEEC